MTMPRQTIREQMQSQRPARKRQLYEVAPSPPRKWRKFLANSSPASSPSKGPLLDNDDDESPSFRAKSFYGSKKKLRVTTPLLQIPPSDEKPECSAAVSSASPSFQAESFRGSRSRSLSLLMQSLDEKDESPVSIYADSQGAAKTPPQRRTRSADAKAVKDANDETVQAKSPRVALSPIKNVHSNARQQARPKTKSASKTVVPRKRHKSLPAKRQSKVRSKASPISEAIKSLDEVNTTPSSGRKFFKHRSPTSASKALGGIIIKRGFNLKFVRGTPESSKSSHKKSKAAQKKKIKSKALTANKRNTSESTKAAEKDSAVLVDGSQVSGSSESTSGMASSFQRTSDLPGSTSSSQNMDTEMISMESEVADSQSLFSSDTLSLASDIMQPTENDELPDNSSLSPSAASSQERDSDRKFYSIFSKKRRSQRLAAGERSPGQITTDSPKDSPKRKFIAKGDDKQLMLDAGQEQFGATQCKVCGMVYTPADDTDEATHARFHQSALAALKFPGWKKERVIKEFLDDGSRVLAVLPEDLRFMVKKVEDVNRVMGQELGFPDHTFSFHGSIKAFLYISDEKRIEGCCIAESITQGNRVLPNKSKEASESQRPWFCSPVPEPASVGIGRLWVYGPSRKRGVASRLVDCIRQWFEYGIILDKSQVAFSDPTPDGCKFAARYTGTPNFLVYKYTH